MLKENLLEEQVLVSSKFIKLLNMDKFLKLIAAIVFSATSQASLMVVDDAPRNDHGVLKARFQLLNTTSGTELIELNLSPDTNMGIHYFLYNPRETKPQLNGNERDYCTALNNYLLNRYTKIYARYKRYTYNDQSSLNNGHGSLRHVYPETLEFVDSNISGTPLDFSYAFGWVDNDNEQKSEAWLTLSYRLEEGKEKQEKQRLFSLPYLIRSSYVASDQWYKWKSPKFQKIKRNVLSGAKPTIVGVEGLDRERYFNDLSVFSPIVDQDFLISHYYLTHHVSEEGDDPVFPVGELGLDLIEDEVYKLFEVNTRDKSRFVRREGNNVYITKHDVWHIESQRRNGQFDLHVPQMTGHRLKLCNGGMGLFPHGDGLYCLYGDYIYKLMSSLHTDDTGHLFDWNKIEGINLASNYTISTLLKDLKSIFLKGSVTIENLTFANPNEIERFVHVLSPHLMPNGDPLDGNRQLTRVVLRNTYLPYSSARTLKDRNRSLMIHGISKEEYDSQNLRNGLERQIDQITNELSHLVLQRNNKLAVRDNVAGKIQEVIGYKNLHEGKIRAKNKKITDLRKKKPNNFKQKIGKLKQQIKVQKDKITGNVNTINALNAQLSQINSELHNLDAQIHGKDMHNRGKKQESEGARITSINLRARSDYPFSSN